MTIRVNILFEVKKELPDGKYLCLQQCFKTYDGYNTGNKEMMFRFIRRSKDGKLMAERGQAAITNLEDARYLLDLMEKEQLQGK